MVTPVPMKNIELHKGECCFSRAVTNYQIPICRVHNWCTFSRSYPHFTHLLVAFSQTKSTTPAQGPARAFFNSTASGLRNDVTFAKLFCSLFRRVAPCESLRLRQKSRINRIRLFFIQAAGLVYHHRAKCGVYHQGPASRPCISSRASVHLPAA